MGVGRVVLFVVVVARVWYRASAMDGDGALCVSGKGMVGLEGVRWLVLAVGGSLFLWISFLFHSPSVLFSSFLSFLTQGTPKNI